MVATGLIAFLLFRRRRRAQAEAAKGDRAEVTSIDGDGDKEGVSFGGGQYSVDLLTPTPFVYSHAATPTRTLPALDLGAIRSTSTSTVTSPADEEVSPPSTASVGPGARRSKPGQVVASPPSLSAAEESRLRVYGRESDAGPVGRPEGEEEEGMTMLPPDYHQVSRWAGAGLRRGVRADLRLSFRRL